jgi:hypothetical protein
MAIYLLIPLPASASSNIPLHSWIYEHLERLVNSGLVDQASLSTKPLNRRQAAEIVAQAVRNLEGGAIVSGLQRPLLEDQLELLIEEFKWELQRMGSYPFGEEGQPPPRWFSLKPLETAYVKGSYAEDPYLLENSKADLWAHGFDLRLGGSSRLELAEYLSFYVHPEYRYDEEQNKGYFLETYGKLSFLNLELEVGRDSRWWGPGYHGSLLLSDHALPLELVEISSASPFRLPWFLRHLGTFDLSFFLARLEEERDFPHAKLMGMRIDWSPFPFLELGASRVILFDGKGRPSYSGPDYLEVLVARKENKPGKFNNNQLASLDATLRIRDLVRYFPLANSLVLYGEYGGEDMAGEKRGVPYPYKAGVIVGFLLQDLFTAEGLDLRGEYARTHKVWYRHGVYWSGYTYRGVLLGHHMGGDADDLYFRLSQWLSRKVQAALDFDQQRYGLSRSRHMREMYVEGSVLLFRPWDLPLSFSLAHRFIETRNAGFQRGEDHRNILLSLEAKLHF